MTIATNMAGRGTDILLGGNPAGLASEILHKRGLNPAEVDKATYDDALAEAKPVTDEDHERVVSLVACTSSAPSDTTPGASTTSSAAAPVARAIPARRASTCRSRTT